MAARMAGYAEHGGPHAFAAARLDVPADLGNQLDLRFDVTRELAIDLFQVVTNRLEDLRERQGGLSELFHRTDRRTLSRPEQGVEDRDRPAAGVLNRDS